MIAEELIPLTKKLDRAGKLQLMQFLIEDLAEEDGIILGEHEPRIIPHQTYPIWSPTDAHGAANTLLKLLEKDDQKYG